MKKFISLFAFGALALPLAASEPTISVDNSYSKIESSATTTLDKRYEGIGYVFSVAFLVAEGSSGRITNSCNSHSDSKSTTDHVSSLILDKMESIKLDLFASHTSEILNANKLKALGTDSKSNLRKLLRNLQARTDLGDHSDTE